MTTINNEFYENISNLLEKEPHLQKKMSKEEWLETAHVVFTALFSAIKNKEHASILKNSAKLSIISENAFTSFGEIDKTCFDCKFFNGHCSFLGFPADKFDIGCENKEKSN